MRSPTPERDTGAAWEYDERRATSTALLGAVLICAGIIALFMFITWLTYAAK